MITRVMGRATETYWKLEPHTSIVGKYGNGEFQYKFDAKPEIIKDVVELDPVEICQYEGKPCVSSDGYIYINPHKRINVGDEEVDVQKEVFYADLNEWKQFVDKVVSNVDYYKEEVELDYADLIAQYNEQMINEDEKLKAYCKLHHLDPARTDVDELKKIVYGNCLTITGDTTMTTASETVLGSPMSYIVSNNTSGWI